MVGRRLGFLEEKGDPGGGGGGRASMRETVTVDILSRIRYFVIMG